MMDAPWMPFCWQRELTQAFTWPVVQKVQSQLSSSERADKNDDSPVTVADYGAQAVVAWSLARADPSSRLSMVAEEDSASLT